MYFMFQLLCLFFLHYCLNVAELCDILEYVISQHSLGDWRFMVLRAASLHRTFREGNHRHFSTERGKVTYVMRTQSKHKQLKCLKSIMLVI